MRGKYALFTLTALVCAVADLATKALVEASMTLHQSIPVVEGLFNLTYVRNPGAAFGILAQSGHYRLPFLLGVTGIAALAIFWIVHTLKPTQRLANVSLAMILGGALGNLVDRVRYGEVIDFLDFYWTTHHWPAFNVADSCITVGVSLLILAEFFEMRRAKDSDQNTQAG
jgi:signal peptidase II